MNQPRIGHNSSDVTISVEVRLFNSLTKFLPKREHNPIITLIPGETIGDIMNRMGIPKSEVFLALCNGRDVTPGIVNGIIRTDYQPDEGDVIALSGPVPFSWGYGAPVV